MFFKSKYGASPAINGPTEYEVAEFHMHHKSEHTIEGVHFDLEMHIVHFPTARATAAQKSNALASAMGIIFDTNPAKYAQVSAETVAAIDAFFDSL